MAFDPDKAKKSVRSLRKSLRSMPRQPSPKQVHDLRTRSRRLEAVVHTLMLENRKEGKRVLRAITPIRKKAGKARDIDVFLGLVTTIAKDEEKECLIELIEYLGSERVKSIRKLRSIFSAHQKNARARLKQCCALIEKQSAGPKKPGAANPDWPATAIAAALEVWTELTDWPRLNASNLHPFRLQVKELRYILRLREGDDDKFVRTLGEVKDAIGEWHDWNELATIAAGELRHGTQCPLVKQLRSTAKQKFVDALSIANAMRKTYQEGKIDWTGTLIGNSPDTRR